MHDTTSTGVVVVSTLLEYIHRLCCQLCIRRTVHTDRTAQRWAALGPGDAEQAREGGTALYLSILSISC
jgi:hypothetical protein